MKSFVQALVTMISTGLLVTACRRHAEGDKGASDSELKRAIVGTWGLELSNVVGTLRIQEDGSSWCSYSNMLWPKAWEFEAQWDITNGILISKVTRTRYWNYTNDTLPGDVDSWEILQMYR